MSSSSAARRSSRCRSCSIAAAPAAAERYVALGDSYSSGTGTRDYSINSGCQRGPFAYPALIDVQRPNTELTFVACGGAQTSNVLEHAGLVRDVDDGDRDDHDRRQRRRLQRRDRRVRQALVGQQLRRPRDDRAELHQQHAARPAEQRLLGDRLARARTRRVVVLGYPRIFMGEDCNAGTFFSGDDMTRLNATADILRNVTRTRAQAYGFTFKDAIPPFTGHAVCSSTEWLNGLSNPVGRELPPESHWAFSAGYAPLVRSVIG